MVQLTNALKEREIENKWLKIQSTFLFEYRELFPADLQYKKGEFSKMLHRIGNKIGLTEPQLRRRIMRWEDSASHYF